jgi:hypothetical protein
VSPARHHRKRRSFWQAVLQGDEGAVARKSGGSAAQAADQLLSGRDFTARLAAYPPDRPIVLWTAPSLPDRLAFWWVLDCVRRARLARGRFWVAEPRRAGEGARPGFHPAPTLGQYPRETFAAAFAGLRPLDARTALDGAALWRLFAAPSPEGLDRARRSRSPAFPDLRLAAETYGSFFPRVSGRRRPSLKLSEVDQRLLDALEAGEWLRPVDVMRKDFRTLELFLPFSDLLFTHRLREWARHWPSEPALLAKAEPLGPSEFTDVAYRLTPRGDRLRRHGLGRPEEAPPLSVGGCCLYAGSPTWVRRDRGRAWRIERLNP